ncbi:MAG: hypothetical protein Q8O64_07240 [Sideroxyarcus sp.]|nr:hypothetical protein [Sideroxyarcus sp.]
MNLLIACVLIFLPQRIKRICYRKIFGYELDGTSRIGFSLLMAENLSMACHSKIGHLNIIKGVSQVSLGRSASIGNLNWISGFPISNAAHFAEQEKRFPALLLGEHAAITNRHLIDCTDAVSIGRFSTFAGFRSQILTHSISIADARQRSGPVDIGEFTFIGTATVILPNSRLPSFSVLAAGAVLNKGYIEEYQLYAGNPARPVKKLDRDAAYFNRKNGYVI